MNDPLPKTLFRFIKHFLKCYPWSLIGIVALSILSGCYATVNAYLMKILIDNVSLISESAKLWQALLLPAILYIINYEIHNLSWRGIQTINIKSGPLLQNQIVQEMFAYVEKHSYRYFQDNFSGSIANYISSIADNIFVILTNIAPFLIRQIVQPILALILMYNVNHYFFFAFLTWVICFLAISLFFSEKISKYSDNLAEGHSKLSGEIVDSVSNSNNVRLFAREEFELNYLKSSLEGVAGLFRKKGWFELKLSMVQGLSVTALIGAMIFGLIHLRAKGLVSVGDFALILSLALYVTEGVWYFTEQVHRLNDLIGRCNQSLTKLVVPHEIIDKPEAIAIHIEQGEIEFSNVTFNYKSNTNIFENKSVIIPGGQRIGLVGFSGSGKTTFVNLIVRLFDVSSGIITIDGQDISAITQSSLREQIGFIPQDPVLFHRSLMENIRYGNVDAKDEEVILAAQKAHAHEFIISTPDSYESLVGERGIKLSGGQRQRISIARAILKNAPILILDEATSALDSVTENYIQDSLAQLMQGKTVIVIAHRLSTLLAMDRILVFDHGKIVEDGNHASLMNQQGMYALLWNRQVGGFILDDPEDAN